jgi:hypothetical protein
MKQITAQEFLEMISENPSVFEHWDTPLEITEYVDCQDTEITHLSQYLTFSGINDIGIAADFSDCKKLKIATGTFHGGVQFVESGIVKIEKLKTTPLKQKIAGPWSSFEGCKDLEVASGTFYQFASFLNSGIHSIKKLHVENHNPDREHANFEKCTKLQTLEGWDLSKPIWIEPEKREAEIKRRQALKKFAQENQAKELPFL